MQVQVNTLNVRLTFYGREMNIKTFYYHHLLVSYIRENNTIIYVKILERVMLLMLLQLVPFLLWFNQVCKG